MGTRLMTAFLGLLALQAGVVQQSGKAVIEGVVVAAADGSPVANAEVTVKKDVGVRPPIAAVGSPSVASAFTDSQGKFAITGIDHGSYRLSARAMGYWQQEYGQHAVGEAGVSIPVRTDETIKDLTIRLTTAGAITGRLVKDDGTPAVGATARLFRPDYVGPGQKSFTVFVVPDFGTNSGIADDRGVYRIYGIPPGRYLVVAGNGPGSGVAGEFLALTY